AVEEFHPARRVLGAGGRHRVDHDRRLLPWNLSTVPTRTPRALRRSAISVTWALYGAMIRTSAPVSAATFPVRSVHRPPLARSRSRKSSIAATSSKLEF